MIVYHGTDSLSAENILKTGIDINYGETSVDNGKGFYTTPNYEFALKRAETMALKKSKFNDVKVLPVVLKIDIDISNTQKLSIKEFEICSYEWKEFIFYNRMGHNFLDKWDIKTNNHNLDSKYDIAINETADNDVTAIISKFRYAKNIKNLKEEISKINKSNSSYWDKQISIHTQRGCSCISSIAICSNENKSEKGMI